MATKATDKTEQVNKADSEEAQKELNLKDVVVLNEPPPGCIGVMYVTEPYMEKQHRDAEYWSERAMNALMWMRIMGFNDQTPSWTDTIAMVEVAEQPENHFYVGTWGTHDPAGMLRRRVSPDQMAGVQRNVDTYKQATEQLTLLKGVGIEPVESLNTVYSRIANTRRTALLEATRKDNDEKVVQQARLKEGTKSAPMPW